MPTILSHAIVPLAVGMGLGQRLVPPRLLVAGMVAAMLPDLDVLAFRWNIPYGDTFGHRGASHSIAFAMLLGSLAWALARRLGSTRVIALAFVAASALSHGLLDMLTNGGHGVALWWPMSNERVFAPWQVIQVSPIGLRRFLDGSAIDVLQSEFVWVWLPAGLVFTVLVAYRTIQSRSKQS